jgi:hypothetical protein
MLAWPLPLQGINTISSGLLLASTTNFGFVHFFFLSMIIEPISERFGKPIARFVFPNRKHSMPFLQVESAPAPAHVRELPYKDIPPAYPKIRSQSRILPDTARIEDE